MRYSLAITFQAYQDMKNLWRTFFGFSDDGADETFVQAMERAKRLLKIQNYEDACRVLKYADKYGNAEGIYLYGWCCWKGTGVVEDAAKAVRLWKKSASMGYQPAIDRCEAIKDFISSIQ